MINLELIRETMREKGLTIPALMEICPVPKSTLERVLSGATANPQAQTLADIAVALGLSMDDIMGIPRPAESLPAQTTHIIHSHNAEVNMLYRSMLLDRDTRIKRLTVAVVVLVLFQMFRWTVDVSNPQLGWIRLDEANTDYVSVFLIAVVVLASVFAIVRYAVKNKKEE